MSIKTKQNQVSVADIYKSLSVCQHCHKCFTPMTLVATPPRELDVLAPLHRGGGWEHRECKSLTQAISSGEQQSLDSNQATRGFEVLHAPTGQGTTWARLTLGIFPSIFFHFLEILTPALLLFQRLFEKWVLVRYGCLPLPFFFFFVIYVLIYSHPSISMGSPNEGFNQPRIENIWEKKSRKFQKQNLNLPRAQQLLIWHLHCIRYDR